MTALAGAARGGRDRGLERGGACNEAKDAGRHELLALACRPRVSNRFAKSTVPGLGPHCGSICPDSMSSGLLLVPYRPLANYGERFQACIKSQKATAAAKTRWLDANGWRTRKLAARPYPASLTQRCSPVKRNLHAASPARRPRPRAAAEAKTPPHTRDGNEPATRPTRRPPPEDGRAAPHQKPWRRVEGRVADAAPLEGLQRELHSLLSEPPLSPSSTASTSPPARGVLGTALQADARRLSQSYSHASGHGLRAVEEERLARRGSVCGQLERLDEHGEWRPCDGELSGGVLPCEPRRNHHYREKEGIPSIL